jgi:hypothetical protein
MFPNSAVTVSRKLQQIMDRKSELHRRQSRDRWNVLKYCHRFATIGVTCSGKDASKIYASKGTIKMQQLYEADPCFFDQCITVWETACGYGGFGQYLSHLYRNNRAASYLYSSLKQSDHRSPQPDQMQVKGSLRMTGDTDGDIRSDELREKYRDSTKLEQPEQLIFDFGESGTNLNNEAKFYRRRKPNGTISVTDAIRDFISMLKPGGKCIFKFVSCGPSMLPIVHSVCEKFRVVKAIKLSTSPAISREWYVYCSQYKEDRIRPELYFEQLLHAVAQQQLEAAQKWVAEYQNNKLSKHNFQEREDWLDPEVETTCSRIPSTQKGKFKDIDTYDVNIMATDAEGKSYRLNKMWAARLNQRAAKFEQYVRKTSTGVYKDFKILPFARVWEHLVALGSFRTKPMIERIKRITNKVIGNAANEIFGWGLDTGCYGITQSTVEITDDSYRTRLDRNPGMPRARYLNTLLMVSRNMESEWGRHLRDRPNSKKLGLLTPDEALAMINKQGATGKFCNFGRMGQYINNTPVWYKRALALMQTWGEGKDTHTYFTLRNKKESKLRKDVDEQGRLKYKKSDQMSSSDLIDAGDMTARQITFADELTRITHIILFGKLYKMHDISKIYKCSINGTPPHYVGRVLRAVWDSHNQPQNRASPRSER